MRKVSIAITGAVILLLVGVLAWTADATPLAGTTGVQSGTYSLIQKAGCNDPEDATICAEGTKVTCKARPEGTPAALRCYCESCSARSAAQAEPIVCPCPRRTCCNPGTGSWKCCM